MMERVKNRNPKNSKVYLAGAGIASLASAVYLVKDAGVPGENIFILEQDAILGGACDDSEAASPPSRAKPRCDTKSRGAVRGSPQTENSAAQSSTPTTEGSSVSATITWRTAPST